MIVKLNCALNTLVNLHSVSLTWVYQTKYAFKLSI